MPELPEVETVKRTIESQIKGLAIRAITVNRPEVVAYPNADIFIKELCGQVISHMERRGKFLMLVLESGDHVILHLRMTGCLTFAPSGYEMEKHTHIIFQMNNGWELRFTDVRRFGRFWYLRAEEGDSVTGISKLGKEPFDSDFDSEYLQLKLGTRKKPIKECLLDQSVIAGIGNIYSDEILYEAQICPQKPANRLSEEEWKRLAAEIPKRLAYFVEKNQISPEEYLAGKGKDYRNTPFLQVYGKSGKACPRCNDILCKCVIGGRSSVYCPTCQKME